MFFSLGKILRFRYLETFQFNNLPKQLYSGTITFLNSFIHTIAKAIYPFPKDKNSDKSKVKIKINYIKPNL